MAITFGKKAPLASFIERTHGGARIFPARQAGRATQFPQISLPFPAKLA